MDNKSSDTYSFLAEDVDVGMRVDKFLTSRKQDLSRSRVQGLIEQNQVLINDNICASGSKKVQEGDVVQIHIPPPIAWYPEAENIPLSIVYEDQDLIVINKQAGLIVHPGAGNKTGTLVNALLYHCGDELSGIGGVMRPGIVHRLDKDTTGLMVVAKNDKAHQGLSDQLKERSLSRKYKALVLGIPAPPAGMIDQPLARHHVYRQKMTVNARNGKQARTHYRIIQPYGEACSMVICTLESGRTHQIRVHMDFIKHPLVGDPTYKAQPTMVASVLKKGGMSEVAVEACMAFPRQALHSYEIAFEHPVTGETHRYEAELPDDFGALIKLLG